MSITAYNTTRAGRLTTVSVTSSLSGTIYFHWFVDGVYVGWTTAPQRTFALSVGEQARVECLDTNDADYDPIANAPAGWPSRKLIWWLRSTASDIAKYRIEQKKGAGAWTSIGTVKHDDRLWSYSLLSPRLEDLAAYTWRIVAIDAAGNEDTTTEIGPETIVRQPDAPDFGYTYNGSVLKTATITAA